MRGSNVLARGRLNILFLEASAEVSDQLCDGNADDYIARLHGANRQARDKSLFMFECIKMASFSSAEMWGKTSHFDKVLGGRVRPNNRVRVTS